MFSVVIPLYNKAAFIERTVRRVQSQTWSDFEVLIIDDGSTDNSADMALQAIEGDQRFRLERVANGGVSAARNRGAAGTSRPWLVFLDADDEWLPDFLSEVAKVVHHHADAVIVSTSYLVRRNGADEALAVPPGHVSECVPYFDWSLQSGPPIWTSAAVVSRHHFVACGGFDETMNMGEDIHLWVRLIQRGRYYFVHTPLAVYDRGDAGSLSRVVSDKTVASRLRLIRFLSTPEQAGPVPPVYIREICKIHFNDLLRAGRYREAFELARSEPHFRMGYGLKQTLRHVRDRMRFAHHAST